MPTEEPQDEALGEDPSETHDKEDAPSRKSTALEEAEAILGVPAEEAVEDEDTETPDESGDPDAEAVEVGEEPEPAEAVETGDDETGGDPEAEENETKEDEADEDEDAESEPESQYGELQLPDDGIKRRWYAIHAYSGQEGAVKKNLAVHAEQAGLSDLLGLVLVPMEEVAEIKSGEKKISKRKFFPGYVLIQLPEHPEHNPELWHMIKETPGVSGFIGSRSVPVPLDDEEVTAIIEEMRGERERPKPKVKFEQSERVKIIDGPFSNFLGNIDKINHERGTLKIMVEIFERLTSVEVEFWQVEKM